MATIVRTCSCAHKYQDEKYGKYMRVHNKAVGSGGAESWTCTVCGLKKGGSGEKKK